MNEDTQPPAAENRLAGLEDLPLRIGLRLQLILSHAGRVSRHFSTLVGYVERDFVIVRAPMEKGFAVPVANGEWVKLRLFTGTQVVEFDASVQRQFGPPLSYWHLTYPERVRTSTLRGAARVPANLAVQVGRDGAAAVEARIVDLSLLGAQIVGDEALGAIDERLQLEFALPHNGDPPPTIRAAAMLRSVKTVPAAGETPARHAHGVQFVDLAEADKATLQAYLLVQLGGTAGRGG